MLDTATVQIIKATVPALQIYANDITSHFYPLLFAQHPEVLPFFNQTNQAKGTQPKALANAVIAYGANIDELGNLSDAVSKIVQKHVALGILPEQYDAVGSCLIQAIKAVLGDAATDEVIDAWTKAYGQLANILIAAEESIYTAKEQQQGGWRGERDFILVKRVDESSVITSFYFQPFDNKGLPNFDAGQFLTLVFDDIDGVSMRRNYSLSDAAGKDYLRISVKREPNGVVSNHLHNNIQLGDKVKLRAPSGDFILRKNTKPLILLTGGVGITPAISMLNTEAGSGRDIRFIHAAINSDVHAFKHHVDQLASTHDHIKPLYVYNQPEQHCQPHATGFIDASIIAEQLPADRDVEFYLLGPTGFMKAALAIATSLGVPESQIHYEFFGPAEALTA
ncbi:NO-inducible flavohemoprotein [Shewanella sp. AC91-MNA-CIBAN-0169]|uniref:NO-inducible flavohemoprotein n=1 Tax=Shewanella sp. AC91-MNA-CIBAN-0169 TaxID=3140466 RepID=UPI003328C338